MSIDARILSISNDPLTRDALLHLGPRDSGAAGQKLLRVVNAPFNIKLLVGECIWGNSSIIMIDDNKFAARQSVITVRLLPPFDDPKGLAHYLAFKRATALGKCFGDFGECVRIESDSMRYTAKDRSDRNSITLLFETEEPRMSVGKEAMQAAIGDRLRDRREREGFTRAFKLAFKAGVRREARKEQDAVKRDALWELYYDDLALDMVLEERYAELKELEAAFVRVKIAEAKAGTTGRDWGAFFDALGKFLQAIMPLILEIIGALG